MQKDLEKNQLGLRHNRWGSLNEKWSEFVQLKYMRDIYTNEAIVNRYPNTK